MTTSDGIIVIDTIFRVRGRGGSRRRTAETRSHPASIKYVIVSHGHRDHSGGAEVSPGLVRRASDHVGGRLGSPGLEHDRSRQPRRDMVATDGQKLTLGDTTLTLYIPPGDTAGTIPTLIPVKDNGRPHIVAEWGGTLFGNATQRTPENLRPYIASAERFQDIVGRLALTSSSRTTRSMTVRKPSCLPLRIAGPVIRIPTSSVVMPLGHISTVAEECAKAALASLK